MNRALASISVIALACAAGCSSESTHANSEGGGDVGTTSNTAGGTNASQTSGGPTGATGSTASSGSDAGASTDGSAVSGTNGGAVTGTDGGAVTGTDGGMTSTNAGIGGAGTSGTPATTGTDGATSTTGAAIPEPTLVTSGRDNYWQIGEVTEGGGNPTVTVDANQTHQDWHGFGGTFNEKGWDALKVLSAEERDRAIRLLFDKQDGAGFTYGRIPIGSSDYGLSPYSLAETPNDSRCRVFRSSAIDRISSRTSRPRWR